MSRQNQLLVTAAVAAIVAVAIYFPRDRSGRVQVTGTVYLDDEPLSVIRGSNVTFFPTEPTGGRREGIGLIEAGGRYRIDAVHRGDGILPGTYRVGVMAWKRVPGWDDSKSGVPLPPEAVPKHYTNVDTTDISVEVAKAGRQSIDIRLSSENGAAK